MRVEVKKIKENAKLPVYATEEAAGCDLHACIDEAITMNPHETKFIPTGLAFALPKGYVGLVYARSGLACKQGLAPANKVGVVDSDFRGEMMVVLHNHSDEIRVIEPNDRIAQFVIMPYLTAEFEEVENLNETKRSDGGFGSTGK